jgi:hypothetical protein
MTEWIDVLVYAALMVVLWFSLPALNARFMLPVVEDRHPGWLAAHPEAARTLLEGRWFWWCAYALGAAGIAVLVAVQTGFWPQALSAPAFEPERWMVLSDVNTGLVFLWLAYFAGSSVLFNHWLKKNVPLAERRQATLERRSIEAFVPPALRAAVYAIVALHLGVWVFVGIAGLYSTQAFWGYMTFQFAIAAVFFLIARLVVLRRPSAMDRIFGPAFRRTEVRFAFVSQLLPLLNGVARLYEEATGTAGPGVDRAARLALIVFMIAGVAVGLFRFTWRSHGSDRDPARTPSSTNAALMLALIAIAGALALLAAPGSWGVQA